MAVWPPEEIVAELAALPRPERPGVRWTTPEQWHVTLRFFGLADIATVSTALATVEATACEAVLGPRTRPLGRGVVMVPVDGLDDVAGAVMARTADIGQTPGSRPFRGHLTLARVQDGPLTGLVGQPVAARFPVHELTVVASHLGRGPARYEVLERVVLATMGGPGPA